MNKKDQNKKSDSYDLMQDTQYLLLGLENSAPETYALEDILAEFGSEDLPENGQNARRSVEMPVQPVIQPEPAEEEAPPPAEESRANVIAFPSPAVSPPQAADDDTMVLIDMREYEEDEPSARDIFGLAQTPAQDPEPEEESAAAPTEPPERKRPLTMEDIVANTVEAVIAEQEQKQHRERRRIQKQRKKITKKRGQPRTDHPIPEDREDPPIREEVSFHKRRFQSTRRGLLFAVPVLVLMWLPWLLEQVNIAVPYFSDNRENAAVCVLVSQMLLSVLCAGVFRAAIDELKQRQCTFYTYAALTDLAALLDAATLLLLPGRQTLPPLGSVAGVSLVFALWGLTSYHRGMWETLRTAGMGDSASAADRCDAGIAKGHRRREGFVVRTMMESTSAQWQRLMLPVLLSACGVFAVLTSVGQGQWQDLIRCWSVMLCASCSLVCPMAYCIPLGRVARRLSRSGTAVAGEYGAAALARSSKLVVTDTDLFPRNSVSIDGIKLFGENRDQAISYAATLAIQGGGCMGRIFEEICRSEHIRFQPLEHFHIHDDNGLSGMIRGETVLVGTPVFMRHKAVRLPSRLPAKTALCLAVDGELTAIFSVKYQVTPASETAMRALSRNRLQLVLATRDGNITPKRLKKFFGTDGKATVPEISDRLALSAPDREVTSPSGLIYRDGLLPFVELVSLSRRLCQTVKAGNLLSMLGSVCGALLGFYMTFVGRGDALSPVMLLIYLLLWTVPMFPLLVAVDKM